ncbi:MAG: AAA family ATPase [Promethearchaeota archaeon]
MALIGTELWEILLFLASLAVFIYLYVLTERDLRASRKDLWSTQDSTALALRYLFFGSINAFLISGLLVFSIWILNILFEGLASAILGISLIVPLISLVASIAFGIAYGIAKSKHLYDLADEEVYGFKPWWARHRRLRKALSLSLYLSTGNYRRWRNAQLTPRKLRRLKRDIDRSFTKTREDLIGRDQEFQTVMSSILYHTVRDERIREVLKNNPPSKFFILKGMTGTGKTLLAEVCMREGMLRGIRSQTNVVALSIKGSDVFNPYYGQSARNLSSIFRATLNTPSVLFFDEFDSFAKSIRKGESHWAQLEDLRVQTTFIEGLKKVLDTESRIVVIAATNSYESVRDDIRRRAFIMDLDQNVSSEMLIAVLNAELEKNGWTYLDPEEIIEALERAVSVYRQTQLTPFDIIDACQKVRNLKIEPIRKTIFEFAEKPVKTKYTVSVDDFRTIARGLRGYLEKEKSSEVMTSILRIKPAVTYKDVGGLYGIKEKIFKSISLSLRPDLATKLGWIPPKGFILWGEPGCGKTHISKAIAKENNATFFYAPAAQLLINAKWVGEPEKNVRDLFDFARKEAPSIIFFDEFDIIAGKRRGDPVGDKITAQILTELDGLQPLENVIVIAATNKLNTVDEAIISRFEPNMIEIPLPRNDEERLDIVNIHLNRYLAHLHSDVTADKIIQILKRHRMVSPRVVAEIIREANRLRSQELFAVWESCGDASEGFVSEIFKEDLERLLGVLEIMKREKKSSIDIKELDSENYKVRLYHFEKAAELLEQEIDVELVEAQESLIPEKAEIGLSFGLATDISGRRGIILIVECLVNKNGTGKVSVTGAAKTVVIGPATTVDDVSVIESATNAVTYIRHYIKEKLDVDISNYDFAFQIISPLEGSAGMGVSGPSLGIAFSTAAISELAKIKMKPNVVMTGKVDIKGNVGPVGGLGWRGTGKFLAAIRTKKVKIKKFLIPRWNYEKSRDEWAILNEKKIEVVPVSKQAEAWISTFDMKEGDILRQIRPDIE